MTATTETRKRTREDDGCDSMPLSKRINNLHINNNSINFPNEHGNNSNYHHPENITINGMNGDQQSISYHHHHQQQVAHHSSMNGFGGIDQMQEMHSIQLQHSSAPQNLFHHHTNNSSNSNTSENSNSNEENLNQFYSNPDAMVAEYNPELDQQQNPYYYNKNKLLFELHAERLRRSNH